MNKPRRKAGQAMKNAVATPELKAGSETLSQTPDFRSELQERGFWERTDSTLHVDWSHARLVRVPIARTDAQQ